MLAFLKGAYNEVISSTTKELPSYILPNDWISKFANLIHTTYPLSPVPTSNDIQQELNQKFNSMNSFQQDNLQKIYAIMSQLIQSNHLHYTREQNPAISYKLYEGMVHCREGFDNRVNELLQGMFSSVSIDEMMQQIREEIALTTAASLTNEVHAKNRVSRIAYELYGVRAINANDIYPGSLDDEIIEKELINNFNTRYKPISALLSLEDQIREALKLRGYSGELLNDDDSYTSEQCTEFIQYLNQLLGTNYELGDIVFLTKLVRDNRKERIADDEQEASEDPADNDYNIVDLDWITIRKDMINKMSQNNLISHSADNLLHDVNQLDIIEQYYVIKHLCTEQEQFNILTNHLSNENKRELFLYVNEQDHDFSPVWLDAARRAPQFLLTIYPSCYNLIDTYVMACIKEHAGIAIACLNAVKSTPELLEDLLGGTVNGAVGFELACQSDQTKIVTACLEAAKSNPALLEKLLGGTAGFELACLHGHTKNVTACLEAAKSNPALLEKLLVGTAGFKLACERGYTDLVTTCLDAAKSNPVLLEKLLGGTAGFELACLHGHTKNVTACLEAAKSNPALLEKLLVGTAGFKLAYARGHTGSITACLGAAKNDPQLFKNLLLTVYLNCNNLQSTFTEACKRGHDDIAMACLDAAKTDPQQLTGLLLSRYPGVKSLAVTFRNAFNNGHDEIAIACLDAVKSNPQRLENLLFGTSLKAALNSVQVLHSTPTEQKKFKQIKSLLDGFDFSSDNRHTKIVVACFDAAQNTPELLENFLLDRLTLAIRDNGPKEIITACLDASKTSPVLLEKVLEKTEGFFQYACLRGDIELVTAYFNAAQSTPELLKKLLLTDSLKAESGFHLSCENNNYDISMLCLERSDDTSFKQLIDTCPTELRGELFEHLITKRSDDLVALLQKLNSENSTAVFKILNKLELPSEVKYNFNQNVMNSIKEDLYQKTSEEIINVYRQKASFFSITRLKMFIGFYKDNVEELVNDLKVRSEKNPFGASTQTLLSMKEFKQRLLDAKSDCPEQIDEENLINEQYNP